MKNEILILLKESKENDYILKNGDSKYSRGKIYNRATYHTYDLHEEEKVLALINNINNELKTMNLFITWLRVSGFINDYVVETFNDMKEFDNPIIRAMGQHVGEETANVLYRELVDNNVIKEHNINTK